MFFCAVWRFGLYLLKSESECWIFPLTSTTTGLTSLNDVTTAHVSATTATTTVTTTQVPATRTAITNVPTYQLEKCKATRTHLKTRSPSILHPAKKAANNATLNLLLPFIQDNLAIKTSSLLLLRDLKHPAIMTATNVIFSLQFIVELLLTGTKQVAPATILDNSFKLIDVLALEGATFAPYIFEDASACTNKSSKFAVASQAMVLSTTIRDNSSGSIKPQKLIVIYSKRSRHFRKDYNVNLPLKRDDNKYYNPTWDNHHTSLWSPVPNHFYGLHSNSLNFIAPPVFTFLHCEHM